MSRVRRRIVLAKTLYDHFQNAVTIVQSARHAAEMAATRSACDSDWDLEAYYRFKAEGLAEAEKILRRHADEMLTGG